MQNTVELQRNSDQRTEHEGRSSHAPEINSFIALDPWQRSYAPLAAEFIASLAYTLFSIRH